LIIFYIKSLIALPKLCICCRAGYWTASIWSAKLWAWPRCLYKAAWPTVGANYYWYPWRISPF